MIPSTLTEDEAIDLALFTLAEALRQRRQISPTVSKTHLMKTVFRIAEDTRLPITRCWFKFGQFVPNERVSPEHFAEVRDRGIGSLSGKVSSNLMGVLRTNAGSYVFFFSQPLDDYLPDYYRLQAPDKYRDIYTSNFGLVSFCKHLTEAPDHRGIRTHYADGVVSLVTKFHRAVAPFIVDSEARSLVVEFTTFLEELVIRFDALNVSQSFNVREWADFFSRAFKHYVEKIWTLPAAQIGAETMVGPREGEERGKMLHTVSLGERHRKETFEPLRNEAEEKGYLPTEADLDGLVSVARQRTSRADAIEELLYLTRKGE